MSSNNAQVSVLLIYLIKNFFLSIVRHFPKEEELFLISDNLNFCSLNAFCNLFQLFWCSVIFDNNVLDIGNPFVILVIFL